MPSSHMPSLRHPSKWMFPPLLLFLAELGCDAHPTYQWKDAVTSERLVCKQCPPGTFVKQHCTREEQTVCDPCPDLHYTQYWNYLEKCRYCNVICGEKQVEVQQCNSTHNRVCQCQEGYYSDMEFCIKHSECPAGSGMEKPGTPFEDTQCQDCPHGFFSPSSSKDPCQPHQDCEQQGKVTNVQGNQYHDTLCTSCRVGRGNSTQEPAVEDEDCQQAMIDFVVYQNIPMKKLKRLQQILERSPKKTLRTKAAIQEKVRTFLTHKKEKHHEVTKKLLEALRVAKLHSIEEKVRKRFLLP
ncbi:PREDICTED: tumor necrosis factor receptor superfamily member 6B [Acanthisitta chloris]|uniref:tumor necrosis factor receptor superfamily member 6B n=1 Tax=Acanthisitta chloris TaxID=57068 RepID=UPI0004F0D163|nr:PREDICTED: tumor necrosis factor receptor superfamily member 6B [Acanthisitta chloris]